MRRIGIALSLLAGLFAFAPPAAAGTLTVEADRATFTAAPGERNDLTAVRSLDRFHLRDDGAPIRVTGGAAGRCEVTDANAVTCAPAYTLTIDAGDETDRFRGEGLGADLGSGDDVGTTVWSAGDTVLAGGDGDDDLRGGSLRGDAGADRLTLEGDTFSGAYGGTGDDVIVGTPTGNYLDPGPGRDVVRAGGGDDVVYEDDSVAADDLDGGAGRDGVSYMRRRSPVVIDLAAASGGAAGDEDRLAGFESATGGEGDDVVRGGPADETLGGFAGDDLVAGGGGADTLDGSLGADRLEGGEGDDAITAGGGDDVAAGGAGADHLAGEDDEDALFGEDGPDVLVGGAGIDLLRGGAGGDRLEAWLDRFHDRLDCGEGAGDEAWVEPGVDDTDGLCERTARARPPSLLAAHLARHGRRVRAARGRAFLVVSCDGPGDGLDIEIRRLGRVVGRLRHVCPGTSDDARFVEHDVRVAVPLARRISRAKRRLRVVVVIGRADGSLPSREPVVLR